MPSMDKATNRNALASAAALATLCALACASVIAAEADIRNPYRNAASATTIEEGKALFNASCAECHGLNADVGNGKPAPDLRRLDRACRRIADAATKAHCMADNDRYFMKSVRYGKVVLGIRHMPAWGEILTDDRIWAIQLFIEAQASLRGESAAPAAAPH